MQKQQNNFDPYTHFGFLTNRTGRLIANRAKAYMDELGYNFPSSCISILADLWSNDGQSQSDLGTAIIKNKSSVNKMLAHLIKDDLIVKKEDPNDRRNKRIFLTSKSREMMEMVTNISDEIDDLLLEKHTSEEIKIAKSVLTNLYHKLSK